MSKEDLGNLPSPPDTYADTTLPLTPTLILILDYFLDNPNDRPHSGVLQKFIEPSYPKNTMYRAIWSESTCLFSKKTNVHPLNDTTINIMKRAITFEGPELFSKEQPI